MKKKKLEEKTAAAKENTAAAADAFDEVSEADLDAVVGGLDDTKSKAETLYQYIQNTKKGD